MYREIILSASYAMGDGYRAVPSELVNTVALLWAKKERGLVNVVEEGSQILNAVPQM